MTVSVTLINRIDQLLPQTQCRRCGYDDCHAYARAIASGEAPINRCPPGADSTIEALAELLKRPVLPLAEDLEPMPVRHVVHIDPLHCIGCTKCILACPVDAIVGAPRFQHQILADRCTGCELCLPPCPTDCISLVPVQEAWQDTHAIHGRHHHQRRDQRLQAGRPRPSGKGTSPGTSPATADVATHGPQRTGAPSAASHRTPKTQEALARQPQPMQESAPLMAAAHAMQEGTAPLPAGEASGSRDPNIALAATDEKARRLAAIRARLKPARPRAPAS